MQHEVIVFTSDRTSMRRYVTCTLPSLPVLAVLLTVVVVVPLPETRSGWWQVTLLGVAVWVLLVGTRTSLLALWTVRLSYRLTATTAELRWGNRVLRLYDDVVAVSWSGRPVTVARLVCGRWWNPDLPQLWIERPGRAPLPFFALLIWDELPAVPGPH